MKRILTIFSLILAMPITAMQKPKSKILHNLGALGLNGFVGWSAFEFITDIKHKKLCPSDFEDLGVRYLKTPEFISHEGNENHQTKKSSYYHEKGYNMDEHAARWYDLIKTGATVPLYVAFINKKIGYGTFAETNINEGEYIGIYTGKVYHRQKLERMSRHQAKLTGAYSWTLPEPFIVDALKDGNELRFVNHNDEANVKSKYIPVDDKWYLVYVAAKPIAKDEQLLVNYGPNYWQDKTKPQILDQKHRFYHHKDLYKKYLEKYL